MEIIPVIDLRKGKAVRAYRGEREKYKDICSAVDLAEIYRDCGFEKVYVADLDAITLNSQSNFEVVEKISAFADAMVDFGIKNRDEFDSIKKRFSEFNSIKLIVGTETYNSKDFPPDSVVSVDARESEIIGNLNFDEVCEILAGRDNEVICIDLSRIGTNNPNIELCEKIYSKIKRKFIYGGGATTKNLTALEKFLKGALIGSEIYDKFNL